MSGPQRRRYPALMEDATGHGTAPGVPAGFRPAAASFLSAGPGFVLGGVGCRFQRACTARLVATAGGGARWHRLSIGGGIDAMAASGATAYAVVSPRGGGREELYASPAGQDAWARAAPMTARRPVLAVSGRAAWFGTSTRLRATAGGADWHRYRTTCWIVAGQPGQGSGNQLWRTSDTGRTWHPASFRTPS